MTDKPKLTVRIVSFSFKKGIPEDPTGNGGGFVFDCRAIPNPGIYEEYKNVTGMDKIVIEYMENVEATALFKKNIQNIVNQSVTRYIEREFTDFLICFGCTGGQHRSVYFAEEIAKYIHANFPVNIKLEHREQNVIKNF
jgi:RNase adaptor protein for sRNA GlmZ degradation